MLPRRARGRDTSTLSVGNPLFPGFPFKTRCCVLVEFNETKESVEDRTRKENFEGGEAFEPDTAEMGLYKVSVNNLLEDKYYESGEESLEKVRNRFREAVEQDPEFPLKLAAYLREELYLRDISQLLLVLSSNHDEAKQYVREWVPEIVQRADEPATAIAMNDELFGKPLPKPLKKGLRDAIHEFDRYQISKYRLKNREVNMWDVFNRVHPKPRNEEEEETYERLMKGGLSHYPEIDELDPPETWEVVISEKGNTAEAWEEVLPRMGMFAKLRNLRNMLEAGVDGEHIFDKDDLGYVKQSKIYPFRFYQAFNAVKESDGLGRRETGYVERWLSNAIDKASENVPDLFGDTVVAVDLSGSMAHSLSNKSEMTYVEISALLGAVLYRNGAEVKAFAEETDEVSTHIDTPVMDVVEAILNTDTGRGSTDGWKVMRDLLAEEREVERIIYLTDCQLWDSTSGFGRGGETVKDWFEKYRDEVAEPEMYIVDLSSYGDLVVPQGYPMVHQVSGWSEKILDYIDYIENPGDALREIKNREP